MATCAVPSNSMGSVHDHRSDGSSLRSRDGGLGVGWHRISGLPLWPAWHWWLGHSQSASFPRSSSTTLRLSAGGVTSDVPQPRQPRNPVRREWRFCSELPSALAGRSADVRSGPSSLHRIELVTDARAQSRGRWVPDWPQMSTQGSSRARPESNQ